VTGFFRRDLVWPDRILLMLCGMVAIIAPTGDLLWWLGNGIGSVFLLLNWRYPFVSLGKVVPVGAARTAKSIEG
jgi:hypothetical protein